MMHYPFNRIGKVCALVGAAVIFPLLAHAQLSPGRPGPMPPQPVPPVPAPRHSVPENGPGMALMITTIGAVLLSGAIQRSRAKT
jgi:hypothetical protein